MFAMDMEAAIRRIRFNLVIIDVTPRHFHEVQASLRDGDNAVLLCTAENKVSPTTINVSKF